MVGVIPLSKKPRLWKQGGVWRCGNAVQVGLFRSTHVVTALGLTPDEAYWRWDQKTEKGWIKNLLHKS